MVRAVPQVSYSLVPQGWEGRTPSSLVNVQEQFTQINSISYAVEDQFDPLPEDVSRLKRCPVGGLVELGSIHATKLVYAMCKAWACEYCGPYRVRHEIRPEVERAMALANELGFTLKLVTFTWAASDLGAWDTDEGRERRRLDVAHFVQKLRRRGYRVEYLGVPEYHKSGNIHIHCLVIMPYVAQKDLSEWWLACTRGSSHRVDVRAVFMRCPECWPGRNVSAKRRAESRITPVPGKASVCGHCGYSPDADEFYQETARWAAREVSKYLTKAPAGYLRRSRGWPSRAMLAREVRTTLVPATAVESEQGANEMDVAGECVSPCACCGEFHTVRYLGQAWEFPRSALSADLDEVRLRPEYEGGCFCFSGMQSSQDYLGNVDLRSLTRRDFDVESIQRL